MDPIYDLHISESTFINLGQVFYIIKDVDTLNKYKNILKEIHFKQLTRYLEFSKINSEFVTTITMCRPSDFEAILFFKWEYQYIRVAFIEPWCVSCARIHSGVWITPNNDISTMLLKGDYLKKYNELWEIVPSANCLYCGGKFDRARPLWVTHLPNNEIHYSHIRKKYDNIT